MKIPSEIIAGDSSSWLDCQTSDNLGNPIDSSWTLTYQLRSAALTLALTAVANGTGWKTTISTTQSATLTPGIYYWQAQASKGSDRVTLGAGQITVVQDLTTATTGYDGRTQSELDLDAVQAAMRAMISGGAVAEYAIGGRSLRKIALADLRALESQLKARVNRERKAQKIANGEGNPNNVFVRF